jgi:DNA-binding CsgD family transcriptional regulator
MSQNDVLTEISGKLDKILKLLAIDTVKGLSTEQEKIELLDSLGFRPVEIARFLNKSPENVSVQLNIIRKKSGKPTKTPTQAEAEKTTTVEVETGKAGAENEPARQ